MAPTHPDRGTEVRAYRERNSTADRALDILGLFSEQKLTISAAELAAEFGVARSTAYRYLQTLMAAGFLEESPTGGFRLGLRVFELARLARRSYGLSDIALPLLRALADATGETALLTRRSGGRAICLERVESESQRMRLTYERGSALALNAGASAWVLLAWEPTDVVEALLAANPLSRYTDRTLTDREEILERLRAVRGQGFAVSYGELDPDAIGIGAPIFAPDGTVVAGVSVVAVQRRTEGLVDEIVDQVRSAAASITRSLALVGN
ncbi:IclR family transcriptional regulator [Microbacterium sp. NPDC091313]